MTHKDQDTHVLDFPGATALQNAGRTQPRDAAVLATAHSLLRQAIAADAEHAVPATTAATVVVTPRFGRRRLAACAAAVAAVAAGVAVLPVVGVGSRPAATASAADVFNSMANQAAFREPTERPVLEDHCQNLGGKRQDPHRRLLPSVLAIAPAFTPWVKAMSELP
ncbi:hypothetical protein ACFYRN_41680 [Streptomyces sp. NPDC005227]|uniref:hypothetical protein n=1 Tax=unclassified Streptomyces TaxID=2593676 RepID=UPI0036792EAE